MIRTLLLLWFFPIALFWIWYALSFYDVNFGTLFFSRVMHDHVFAVYAGMIGIDPATIPAMIGRALALDSVIVLAVAAFRRRDAIAARLARLREQTRQASVLSPSEESLSSAP